MRTLPGVGMGLVVALLAGCAAPANPPPAAPTPVTATPVPPPTAAAPPPPPPPPAAAVTAQRSGPSFLSIVGTPFLIIFKIPVCLVTAVVAAPLAGLSELPSTANTEGLDMRNQLENGLAQNCGPPWTISP